jgi:hypothetical protein
VVLHVSTLEMSLFQGILSISNKTMRCDFCFFLRQYIELQVWHLSSSEEGTYGLVFLDLCCFCGGETDEEKEE